MLHCNKLTCVREERILFKDLSFTVKAGQIVQIAGVNGAGKTTLFRSLAGLSAAYSGDVFWQGRAISADRESFCRQLLYIGHKTAIKPELTALENLQYFQKMHSSHAQLNIWDVLAKVGLAGYEDICCSQLSAGQQRRVALARLWLNNCVLWVLDEPFSALDEAGVASLEALFIKHAANGGMVLLTSHQDLALTPSLLTKITLRSSAGDCYV